MSTKCLFCVLFLLTITILACGSSTRISEQLTPRPKATVPKAEASNPTAQAPADTATPEPTATVEPTATPEPPVQPISLSGTGDSVVDTGKGDVPMLAVITGNQEGRYFAVTALDDKSQPVDLLVNTTEAYNGIRPVDFNKGRVTIRFQVQAAGPWKIELQPLSTARKLEVPGEITGKGDEVIALTGAAPDVAEISGNAGKRFFGVIAHGSAFPNLLVNTTDPYEGKVIIPAGSLLLAIQATGDWRIKVSGK